MYLLITSQILSHTVFNLLVPTMNSTKLCQSVIEAFQISGMWIAHVRLYVSGGREAGETERWTDSETRETRQTISLCRLSEAPGEDMRNTGDPETSLCCSPCGAEKGWWQWEGLHSQIKGGRASNKGSASPQRHLERGETMCEWNKRRSQV